MRAFNSLIDKIYGSSLIQENEIDQIIEQLQAKVDEIEILRAKVEAEYEQLKLINSDSSILDEW